LAVTAGSQGTVSLTVTPENGFNSTVSFACSGLPTGSSCSFNPSTIVPSGGSISTVMTISTSLQSADSRPYRGSPFGAAVLGFAICVFGWKRRRLQQTILVAMLFGGLATVYGCGGAQAPTGSRTNPVTSTVTVSATSSSIQQTTSISLTVN
jgi:hypothetical protein